MLKLLHSSLISHVSKVMLKILQARLQQYLNHKLPGVQAGFRKGRGTRDQIANICWIIEKLREFQKASTFASLTTLKLLTVWITTSLGKFKRWEYQTTLSASWETCRQVKKQQLELDMAQWTSSKLGKECVKSVHCHSGYLTYMYHVKCWAGWITSWNQDCQEKYQQPQICRWHHPYGRKWRGTKEPLDESERGKWKSWFKTQHSSK